MSTTYAATRNAAHGPVTVRSQGARVECHAASGYTVRDFSGANGARDRQRAMVLAFWEAQGVARYNKRAGGVWQVRDMVNGGDTWLPLATRGEESRADRAEFSHVVSAAHDGAWCACNLLPECGAVNAARGDANITTLPMSARALLAAWPAWWTANVARKASLARLAS